jgi:hypothetical protein
MPKNNSDLPSSSKAFEEEFAIALVKLASLIDASNINENGTLLKFNKKYSTGLHLIDNRLLEMVTHHNRRYIILNEKQVLALINAYANPSAAHLLVGLPLPVATEDIPRSRILKTSFVRLGRLPK